MRTRWLVGPALFFLNSAVAAAPGDLYVTTTMADSVYRIQPDGTKTEHADGLDNPVGICFGPNGDLYVAESTAEEISIITGGGSFLAKPAWATGINAHWMWCSDTEVWVVDSLTGELINATAGGDLSAAPSFATVPPPAFGIHQTLAGTWLFSGAVGQAKKTALMF